MLFFIPYFEIAHKAGKTVHDYIHGLFYCFLDASFFSSPLKNEFHYCVKRIKTCSFHFTSALRFWQFSGLPKARIVSARPALLFERDYLCEGVQGENAN